VVSKFLTEWKRDVVSGRWQTMRRIRIYLCDWEVKVMHRLWSEFRCTPSLWQHFLGGSLPWDTYSGWLLCLRRYKSYTVWCRLGQGIKVTQCCCSPRIPCSKV
jgi:hypothetical protein